MQVANDIRPEGYILRFNSLLFEILFQLCHNFSVKIFQADLNHRTKDLNRLNLILNYTNQNYDRAISIDEIARVACLDAGYFCRFSRSTWGSLFWNTRMRCGCPTSIRTSSRRRTRCNTSWNATASPTTSCSAGCSPNTSTRRPRRSEDSCTPDRTICREMTFYVEIGISILSSSLAVHEVQMISAATSSTSITRSYPAM